MQWKEFTRGIIEQHCQASGQRTFTLQELLEAYGSEFQNFSANNNHPFDKVRQVLQVLRDEGQLEFVNNEGTYRLR